MPLNPAKRVPERSLVDSLLELMRQAGKRPVWIIEEGLAVLLASNG